MLTLGDDRVLEAVARKLWEQACSEHDYDWDENRDSFIRQALEVLTVISDLVQEEQ